MGGSLMTLSLWLDTPRVSRPRLDGRKEADAIVLGAGMTGIGLAYFLSELRVRTLVLEAESVACGATGRNMGLLISGLGEHYARSVAFWGRSEAAAITSLHLDNQDLVGELVRHHGIECGYRRSGCYAVGADIQEEEELRQSCLLMQEDGFPCSFLDARNMNLALGGRGFFGGMHCPRDGVVDPVRLVRGLACAAERGGAVILERSSVQSISRDGLRWVVKTNRWKGFCAPPLSGLQRVAPVFSWRDPATARARAVLCHPCAGGGNPGYGMHRELWGRVLAAIGGLLPFWRIWTPWRCGRRLLAG